MKKLFDTLGDSLRARIEDPKHHIPLEKEETYDFIRSYAESSFRPLKQIYKTEHQLMEQSQSLLAQHLLWTFGPKHPDLPFLLQLRCQLEGDLLLNTSPEIGWNHQGIEKKLEFCNYRESLKLLEDLNPENPITFQLLYMSAYEKHLGILHLLADHTQLFRLILVELSRIFDHLSSLYQLAMAHLDVHSQYLLRHAKHQVKSQLFSLMNIAESFKSPEEELKYHLFGNRKYEEHQQQCTLLKTELPNTIKALSPTFKLLSQNPSFQASLAGLGRISTKKALELGITGPALRATGLFDDLREHSPYLAYQQFKLQKSKENQGDALARFFQRVDEISQSSRLIVAGIQKLEQAFRQSQQQQQLSSALEELPKTEDGEIILCTGHSSLSFEAASGELHIFLAGNDTIYPNRLHFKGASTPLCAALSQLCRNTELDRIISLILSLGITPGELDR